MTVVSSVARNDYVGSGITGPYAYTFRIFVATDLAVIQADTNGVETVLSYPADYSISGVGNRTGGAVTLTVALPVGYALTLQRAVALTQPISLRNQGDYFPENVEDGLDRLTMIAQQQQTGIDRGFQVPPTVPIGGNIIENFVSRAYIRVNLAGDGLEGVTATVTTVQPLTPGAYLTGSAFDGSQAETFAVDATSTNTPNKVVARGAAGEIAIGALTATAGNFSDTTDSSSSTTGSLKTAGGLGVAKKLFVGTGLFVAAGGLTVTLGVSAFNDTTDSSSSTTGAVTVAGGVGIAKKLTVGTGLTVTAGGIIVTAGTTAVQALTATTVVSSDTTDSSSSTTGAMKTAGGLGVAKALFVGTGLTVAGASSLQAATATGVTTKATGQTHAITISQVSNATTYGALSFNDVLTAAGMLGMSAGGGSDTTLYFKGGASGFAWHYNAAAVATLTNLGALTLQGGLTVSAGGITVSAGSLTLPLGAGTGVVSVGATDSGGTGFRLLRVPN